MNYEFRVLQKKNKENEEIDRIKDQWFRYGMIAGILVGGAFFTLVACLWSVVV